jgi:hypothetical protein
LKAKLLAILAVAVFVFSSVIMAQAQTETSIWRDDMSYSSFDQMQAAGWTSGNPTGVKFGASGVILDGTDDDTSIHYSDRFPLGVYDWKVESKSRWTLGSHSGNNVGVITEKHAYLFGADGWYSCFSFYRDGNKLLTFGNYQEKSNEWITIRMEKHGSQISMYINDQLKNTYTETDPVSSQLTGYNSVSPWRGGSEYDYFEVWSTGSNVLTPQTSLLSNPIVIGGIVVGIAIGVGGVVYFFVLGGGGAAGSSGGAAGGGTDQGGHGSSGSSSHPEQPYSNDNPYSPGQTDPQSQSQLDNSQNTNNYNTQQSDNPYSSGGQTNPQSQLDNSQNSNYGAQQPEDNPYSPGQTDPQSQSQLDNSQNTNNYNTQQSDNPYSSGGQTNPQSQLDNSQNTNNYESSRGTNEDTKSNKKSSTKTE